MEEIKIKEGYTRVSEVLGWYKSLVLGQIDRDVLERKTLVGTEVHEAIAGYFEGIFVPLSEKAKGYFESFKVWLAENPCVIAHQERRFYCEDLMLTGAIDMIVMTKSGLKIIDFKTSATADKKGWEMQAAFYRYLCKLYITEIQFVKLDKDGKKPKIFDFKPSQESWEIALQCYRIYKFWKE